MLFREWVSHLMFWFDMQWPKIQMKTQPDLDKKSPLHTWAKKLAIGIVAAILNLVAILHFHVLNVHDLYTSCKLFVLYVQLQSDDDWPRHSDNLPTFCFWVPMKFFFLRRKDQKWVGDDSCQKMQDLLTIALMATWRFTLRADMSMNPKNTIKTTT